MKTFITFLLISVLFAVLTYAMADASASTHSYFEQVRANSFPDTTNKHQLLDQVKKRGYVRVIVKYNMDYTQEGHLRSDAQKNAQRQSISQMHDTFLEDIKELNASAVKRMKLSPLLALTVDEEALKYLYRSPLIKRIYFDHASKAFLSESISIVKADDTWEGFAITGSSTKIVIIDSGVDAGHEMLSGKVIDGACFNTNDQNLNISTLCPNAAESDYGVAAGEDCGSITGCNHGTHVAGIAAGSSVSYYSDSYSGVAKEAKIISIQVFSKYGNDLDCEDTDGDGVGDAPCIASQLSDQISALEWIYTQYGNDNSVAAVNMSLGDGEYTSVCDTDPRKDAIDNISSNGKITIAASGNENNSNALSAPACISSVISVGATNDQDTHWSDSDSSGSNAASFLDLVAPGVSIISSVPGNNQYASLTGTSMAAPHVAGTIALMNEVYPNQPTSIYRTILQNTAEDVSAMYPYSFTDEYGHGRLNTFEAVTQSLINNPSVYVYDYSHTFSPGEEFLDETIVILDGNSLTVNEDLYLTNTTLYIHGTLDGSGTIYLYGNSEILERLGGENNFQGNVNIYEDAYLITIRNNFDGYFGGQVGVGKNVSPVNRTSPHQKLVSDGDTLNLEAYDNQTIDGYIWVFNDTEGSTNKSRWFIEQGGNVNPLNDSFNQSPNHEVDNDQGAVIYNVQKRIFNINRNDYSPETDNTFNTANVQVIEGNTLTAPSTQTVNGTTYTFFEWSDGVTENPRTIDSPTTSLTAHYKAFNATNSADVMGTDQRRKIVEDIQHNKVYRVYESSGLLWYQWRDRNTNTWS